jgi:hypothetical protein
MVWLDQSNHPHRYIKKHLYFDGQENDLNYKIPWNYLGPSHVQAALS